MPLVSDSGGGRQEEGPRHYGEDEWETEEGKWMMSEGTTVPGAYCALIEFWTELFGLKSGHVEDNWMEIKAASSSYPRKPRSSLRRARRAHSSDPGPSPISESRFGNVEVEWWRLRTR